jgi:hypothetical protein
MIMPALFFMSCKEQKKESDSLVVGTGKMPTLAKDNQNNLYVVYGSGDSIMYASSGDQGKTFSAPALVTVLPKLAASHMRGPQIACTDGVIITALNKTGDIFSYRKEGDKWIATGKLNDVDTVAKEGLMALAADGQNAFATWLDLRDGHNKLFGSRSTDGGKTWSKNVLVYASPDTTVCECCKPSVALKGEKVYVMFRNWLNGNRDLHLIESTDGGATFGEAQKLGNDSWALNGCPMDGGGITIHTDGQPQTVWRRKNKIYASEPGQPEKEIGEGRGCTITSVNGKNTYAWTEKGEVVIIQPNGMKKVLGTGSSPVITGINNEQVLCVWEREGQIHSAIVSL